MFGFFEPHFSDNLCSTISETRVLVTIVLQIAILLITKQIALCKSVSKLSDGLHLETDLDGGHTRHQSWTEAHVETASEILDVDDRWTVACRNHAASVRTCAFELAFLPHMFLCTAEHKQMHSNNTCKNIWFRQTAAPQIKFDKDYPWRVNKMCT